MVRSRKSPEALLQAALDELEGINDPVEQAQAATRMLAKLGEASQHVKDVRHYAVVEARQERKVAAIANDLGISVPRVYAILKGTS